MTVNPSSKELADRVRSSLPADKRDAGDCPERAGICWCKQNAAHDALDALAARLQAAEQALRPFAYPFAYGEPTEETWEKDDLEIDCCVTITYSDVLSARRALEDAAG